MAEKEQQQPNNYTSPQVNPYGRVDEEVASVAEREARRKKRMKYLMYFVLFVIFQTIVITIFALTVMKVRGPKYRVRSATFETFELGTAQNPSFNLRMNARIGVKNNNFGPYKYQNSTITFYYRGTPVGEAFVPRRTAGLRSTRRFNVLVNLSSNRLPDNSQLGNDLNSGVLTLNSQSRLNGKVTLMFIMKKKKATNMNCTMEINTASKQLQSLTCR